MRKFLAGVYLIEDEEKYADTEDLPNFKGYFTVEKIEDEDYQDDIEEFGEDFFKDYHGPAHALRPDEHAMFGWLEAEGQGRDIWPESDLLNHDDAKVVFIPFDRVSEQGLGFTQSFLSMILMQMWHGEVVERERQGIGDCDDLIEDQNIIEKFKEFIFKKGLKFWPK